MTVSAVRLSTVRIPTIGVASMANPLYEDGYHVTPQEFARIENDFKTADQALIPRCFGDYQPSDLLPCVTGSFAESCVSGTRHCGSAVENSENPSMDAVLSRTPSSHGNRLWGFKVLLPANEELASLFFASSEATGGTGYTLEVMKSDGSPVRCQPQAAQPGTAGLTSDRTLLHTCASAETADADLYSLGDVLRVRISLPGNYRQIWIRKMEVLEISLAPRGVALPPRPPKPPPLPMLPSFAPNSLFGSCTFYEQKFFDPQLLSLSQKDVGMVAFLEPCGLTRTQCCEIAHDNVVKGVDFFQMDDAGCCLLIARFGQNATLTLDTKRWGYLSTRAGTGEL